jgi:hypothetical protein
VRLAAWRRGAYQASVSAEDGEEMAGLYLQKFEPGQILRHIVCKTVVKKKA